MAIDYVAVKNINYERIGVFSGIKQKNVVQAAIVFNKERLNLVNSFKLFSIFELFVRLEN